MEERNPAGIAEARGEGIDSSGMKDQNGPGLHSRAVNSYTCYRQRNLRQLAPHFLAIDEQAAAPVQPVGHAAAAGVALCQGQAAQALPARRAEPAAFMGGADVGTQFFGLGLDKR